MRRGTTSWCLGLMLVVAVLGGEGATAGSFVLGVKGDQILLNDEPVKLLGLRCSNSLISDATTDRLIAQLDTFKGYGVNTVSVFLMGSRFGDVKGYRADATLDPTYASRLGRIIEAADRRGMVVLVGCLYWSTSRAKEELGDWTQEDANQAIANTIRWLVENDYRNVFVDPDNEGMAHDANNWDIAEMIKAAHAIDPTIMVAYNDSDAPPANADLYIHHSPKVPGKPWLDSEATPHAPGGYWGKYSKQTTMTTDGAYYNYSRIGRYTPAMKQNQCERTEQEVERYNGHVLASTWLQCAPTEGVGGPWTVPGGRSEMADVDQAVDTLHPDAGILWWLEFIQDRYGAWVPPGGEQTRAFRDLFNGKDLSGWVNVNTAPDTWSVRDGLLVCSGHPIGVMRSDRQYENFVLHIEWRHMEAGGNSGVFLWSTGTVPDGRRLPQGMEVQMLELQWVDLHPRKDGTLPPIAYVHGELFGAGGMKAIPENPRGERSKSLENRCKGKGQWNVYDVVAVDGTVKLSVNGKFVNGIRGASVKKGYLCLESEGAEVHFRNIRILELPPGITTAEQTAPLVEEQD